MKSLRTCVHINFSFFLVTNFKTKCISLSHKAHNKTMIGKIMYQKTNDDSVGNTSQDAIKYDILFIILGATLRLFNVC